MKIRDNSGGMLLFAIITCMVISFTCVTLMAVGLNQARMTEMEIQRKQALNLVRAGYEYAYDSLGRGETPANSLPGHPDVLITIETPGQGDPAGVNYRIEVSTVY